MAISLKQQILLAEVMHYTPPYIDVTQSGRSDTATREAATRMFYDFYAMEFLHRMFGSSYEGLTPQQKMQRQLGSLFGAAHDYYSKENEPEKPSSETPVKEADEEPEDTSADDVEKEYSPEQEKAFWKALVDPHTKKVKFDPIKMTLASTANWPDIEEPMSGVILPDMLVRTIENMYQEVTIHLARKLLQHLRLTLVQELRHLINHSSAWSGFRQRVLSHYQSKKTLTNDEFKQLIDKHLPSMKAHPDSVKRLLLFSRYYSKMTGDEGKDPADLIGKGEPQVAPQPEEEPYDIDKDPSAIDISKEPPADIEEPEGEEIPDYPGWEPETGAPFDPEDPFGKKAKKLHEDYASGRISPSTIKKVNKAINKSGLTWEDIVLAYNNVPWGGGYGGPKWGAGVVAFLKLVPEAKIHNLQQIAGLVDHIFDLQHNNGALLNKGGMYIPQNVLDRRSKVSHVARYLPDVSPSVRNIILRVLKYLPGNAEIQKNIGAVTNSQNRPFTPEEMKEFEGLPVQPSGNTFVANVPFENKQGGHVSRTYTIQAHTNGMFSVVDSLDADTQVFPDFKSMMDHVKGPIAQDMKSVAAHGVAGWKPPSEKDLYIQAHTRTKLDGEKEKKLLDQAKMGWRSKSKYYKAYFSGDKRFVLYAFTDGSFLTTYLNPEPDLAEYYAKFTDFEKAFEECLSRTKDAMEYPDKATAMSQLGGATSKAVSSPSTTPTVAPSKDYYLDPSEQHSLQTLVGAKGNYGVYQDDKGMYNVRVNSTLESPLFGIGRKMHSPAFGKPYVVKHYTSIGSGEKWTFQDFTKAYNFIKNNWDSLIVKTSFSPVTAITPSIIGSTSNMPANATSPAVYKMHAGIATPPKHTIRLTTEDEATLKGIGFEPKMISQDVWYIHKGVGDTVKFYPNDTAKIIFTAQTSGGAPVVKFTIQKMLAWLAANYTPETKVSPIKAGGKPVQTPPKPSPQGIVNLSGKGIKAGGLFDSKIYAAGFQWDNTTGQYQDGQNSLNIKPDRSSVLNIYNGPTKSFKNLPELLTYLETEYPDQKKKLATAEPEAGTLLKKKSKPEVEELKKNLKAGGFKKIGHPATAKVGITYKNADGDVVNVYSDGTSDGYYKSVATQQNANLFKFATLAELNNFLSSTFGPGDIGGLETGAEPVGEHNGITQQEYGKIKDLIGEKHPKYMCSWFQYQGLDPETTPYVAIYKKPKDETVPAKYPVVFKVGALGNYYQVNDTNDKPVQTVSTFQNLLDVIDILLTKDAQKVPEGEDNLSSQQVEQLQDLVSKYSIPPLKPEYLTVAKSSTEEAQVPHWILSSNMGSRLLALRKFKDVFAIYKVMGSTWDHIFDGDSFEGMYDALHKWLETYFGGGQGEPVPYSQPPPSPDPNKLSEEEVGSLKVAIAPYKQHHPKLQWEKASTTGKPKVFFRILTDHEKDTNKEIISLKKKNGEYVINAKVDGEWKLSDSHPSFLTAYNHIISYLQDFFASTKSDTLTEDEKEWIETFIKTKMPDLHVMSGNDGIVNVLDTNQVKQEGGHTMYNLLFTVWKTKSSGYKIILYNEDWGQDPSTQYFVNFEAMKNYIQSDFSKLTQLAHLTNTDVDETGELPDVLKSAGFVYQGPNQGIAGGQIYHNPQTHDRVVWHNNDTFIVYFGGHTQQWKEFANAMSLIEWLKEHCNKAEHLSKEAIDLLKQYGYQSSELGENMVSWYNQHDDTINLNMANGTVSVYPGHVSSKYDAGDFTLDSVLNLITYLNTKHGPKEEAGKFLAKVMQSCKFEILMQSPIPQGTIATYTDNKGNYIEFKQDGSYHLKFAGHSEKLLYDAIDTAYVISELLGINEFGSKPSFLKGQTGDNDLDNIISTAGFEYDGAKPGDVLAMVFKHSEAPGVSITIYDDKSSKYEVPSLGDIKGYAVDFSNLTELKEFLMTTYANKLKQSPENQGFPSDPNLAQQWKDLWNKLLDVGFDSSGGEYKTKPKRKDYKHPDGTKISVWENGICHFTPLFGDPKEFKQFYLLENYLNYIYLNKEKYSKHYYDDLGEDQMAYSIRLTEEDENIMKAMDWVWVPAGESQIPSAYVHKDTGKRVIFYNKSLNANKNTPIATLADTDKSNLIDFITADQKHTTMFHIVSNIAGVIAYLKEHPEKMTDEKKYSKHYYDDVAPDNEAYGIRLKKEHDQLLEDHGFLWQPKLHLYLCTTTGQYAIFYNKKKIDKTPVTLVNPDKTIAHSWNEIEWALKDIAKKFAPIKGGPYSFNYYDAVGPSQDSVTIRLTRADEAILTKAGYKWVPKWVSGKPNAYVNVLKDRRLLFPNIGLADEIDPNYKHYHGAMLQSYDGGSISQWQQIDQALEWIQHGSGNKSKLTYNEGAPLMNTKFTFLGQYQPHAYSDMLFKYNVSPVPQGGEGTGEIVISLGDQMKFAIGKVEADTEELEPPWYIRQATTKGEKLYTFFTVNNLFHYLTTHAQKFLNYEPVEDEVKKPHTPTGFKTDLGKESVLLPSEYWDKQNQAGFDPKHKTDGVVYEHTSGEFYFKYYPLGMLWSTEKGMKEVKMTSENLTKFLDKIFDQCSPQMNGEELDAIFSRAYLSRRDKIFDKILRLAEKLKGGSMEGTAFHDELMAKGFEVDETTGVYSNYDVYQAVVVTPQMGYNKYHIYWIKKDNTIAHSATNNKSKLILSIGKGGAIDQKKDLEEDELKPSGEDYKTHSDEANADLIPLNEHDTALLAKCGFIWSPSVNHQYNNERGDWIRFYDTGKAKFYEESSGDVIDDFKHIPHALRFIVVKYSPNAQKEKLQKDAFPFSGADYAKEYPHEEEDVKEIRLNDQDESVLKNLGFKWNAYGTSFNYIKDVAADETPNLEEAEKKKKKGKKKEPKYQAQQFELPLDDPANVKGANLPPDMEPWFEVVTCYNTGNAIWEDTDDPANPHPSGDDPKKIKQGTILEILQFVWHRWKSGGDGGTPKTPEGTPPESPMGQSPLQYIDQLTEMGFEQVPPETVLPKHWQTSAVKLTYFKSTTKEVLAINEDGTVAYGAWTNENNFIPYSKFSKLKDAVAHFLFSPSQGKAPSIEDLITAGGSQDYFTAPNELKNYAPYAPKKSPTAKQAIDAEDAEIRSYGFSYSDGIALYTKNYGDPMKWEAIRVDEGYVAYFYPDPDTNMRKYYISQDVGGVLMWVDHIGNYAGSPQDYTGYFNYKNYPNTKTDNLAEDEGLMLNTADHTAALAQGFEWLPDEKLYNHPNKDQFQVKNSGWTWYFINGTVGNNTTKEAFKVIKAKYDFQPGAALDIAKKKKHPMQDESLRVKAKVPTHHKLTTELGYTWVDGVKLYQKNDVKQYEDYIIFLQNGNIIHRKGKVTKTFATDGELIAHLKGTTPKAKMPWSDFDYEAWGKGEMKSGKYSKTDTIQLVPEDHATMEKLGFQMMYTGAEHEPKFSNVYFNNKGDAVVFHVDGMSHWTHEGKNKTSWNTPKAMVQWLWDNQKEDDGNFIMVPADVNKKKGKKVTGEMPYSGMDYSNIWQTQKLFKKTPIALVDEDAETLKSIGFTLQYDNQGHQFYGKGTEKIVFYADGTGKYSTGKKGPSGTLPQWTDFDTVKEGMERVWENHAPFIEESAFKSFMKKWLE